MNNYLNLYKEVLSTTLKPKRIAVYGIANYDDIFSISKKQLINLKINPVFDDIASRTLKNNSYSEYNRDIHHINEAIERLKKVPLKEKVILGGNATNISLALTAFRNHVHLNVKRATSDMLTTLKSAGIESVNSSIDEAAHHLIVQIKEDCDRFIISPDYGMKEPELIDFTDIACDFAVYSGAHLDAKSPKVQKELLKRVKNISKASGLYIELGSGSRMAEDNCKNVSRYADILGMNEAELETMTGKKDLVAGASQYHENYMKPDSILLVHTMKGSLALSKKQIKGLPKAQVMGHLSGTSRYMYGRYISFSEMKESFKDIQLHKNKTLTSSEYHTSWVSGIKHSGPGMAVGSGDGYVAGFITGLLNFSSKFR